jgi:hypothetical protein
MEQKKTHLVAINAGAGAKQYYEYTECLSQKPSDETTIKIGKYDVCGGKHRGGVLCKITYLQRCSKIVDYKDPSTGEMTWRIQTHEKRKYSCFFAHVSALENLTEKMIRTMLYFFDRTVKELDTQEKKDQYIAKHNAMYAEGKKIFEDAIAEAKVLAERRTMEDKNVGLISASLEQNPQLIVRVFQTNPDLIAHVFRSSPDLIAKTFRSNPDILTSILRGEMKLLMPEIVSAMITVLGIKN